MRAPTGFAANKRPLATSSRTRPSSDVEDRTELETRAHSMRGSLATDVPGVNDEFSGRTGRRSRRAQSSRACARYVGDCWELARPFPLSSPGNGASLSTLRLLVSFLTASVRSFFYRAIAGYRPNSRHALKGFCESAIADTEDSCVLAALAPSLVGRHSCNTSCSRRNTNVRVAMRGR